MPAVDHRPDPMAPAGVLVSWMAATLAIPLTLFTAAAGQGLGTIAARGGWIGVCVPWDQQAWALVNQPVLSFAATLSATGYWCGSLAAGFLVAALGIPIGLRLRSLAAHLFCVQWCWTAITIGLLWQPALDPQTSHFTRWLKFRDAPTELRWIAVVLAAAVTIPVILRLLSLARIKRYHMSRWWRMLVVVLHLIPIPAAWIATWIVVHRTVPVEACVVTAIPIIVGVLVAWIGYPMPLTHLVEAPRPRAIAALTAAGLVAWAAMWCAGRPLPDSRFAAVQWGRDGSFNNIRPWMQPSLAPWLRIPGAEIDIDQR